MRSDRQARGAERRGTRYAVELQADFLPLESVIVAPTTTNPIGAAFWPAIELGDTTGYVLVEQMMAVDRSRLGGMVGRITLDEQLAIDERIRDVLGL